MSKEQLYSKINELRELLAQAKCDGIAFNLEEAPTLVDAEFAGVIRTLEDMVDYYVD